MANPTRSIHLVRCRNKNDDSGDGWADVVVLDAVVIVGPDGEETTYDVKAKDAIPCVIDKNNAGNSIGDIGHCSRVSHIETFGFCEAEVLDGFCLIGPNGDELVISIPSRDSTPLIIDKTGAGLADTPDKPTRAEHIALIKKPAPPGIESSNTDYPGEGGAPDDPPQVVATTKVDAICFIGPNGDELTLDIAKSLQNAEDTTKYDGDGNPPDNTDPNPYVFMSANPWMPMDAVSKDTLLEQGPLWFVKKISVGRLWAVYVPAQTITFYSPAGDPSYPLVSNGIFLGDGGLRLTPGITRTFGGLPTFQGGPQAGQLDGDSAYLRRTFPTKKAAEAYRDNYNNRLAAPSPPPPSSLAGAFVAFGPDSFGANKWFYATPTAPDGSGLFPYLVQQTNPAGVKVVVAKPAVPDRPDLAAIGIPALRLGQDLAVWDSGNDPEALAPRGAFIDNAVDGNGHIDRNGASLIESGPSTFDVLGTYATQVKYAVIGPF